MSRDLAIASIVLYLIVKKKIAKKIQTLAFHGLILLLGPTGWSLQESPSLLKPCLN